MSKVDYSSYKETIKVPVPCVTWLSTESALSRADLENLSLRFVLFNFQWAFSSLNQKWVYCQPYTWSGETGPSTTSLDAWGPPGFLCSTPILFSILAISFLLPCTWTLSYRVSVLSSLALSQKSTGSLISIDAVSSMKNAQSLLYLSCLGLSRVVVMHSTGSH